jgi:hypothetical protein
VLDYQGLAPGGPGPAAQVVDLERFTSSKFVARVKQKTPCSQIYFCQAITIPARCTISTPLEKARQAEQIFSCD